MNNIVKYLVISTICISLTAGCAYFLKQKSNKELTNSIKKFSTRMYKTERNFITSIPIYRDYATKAKEMLLMKYNLNFHRKEVVKHLRSPLLNDNDLKDNIKKNNLLYLETDKSKLYYFHNVRKKYRYLTPEAKKGLILITNRFQEKLQKHKNGLPKVKLAVSSVIRTAQYQKKLFGREFVSTHSYGGCFDIFFEDFYVKLPEDSVQNQTISEIKKTLQRRFGFMMGDSLRRQLRTVLMETLLELQKERLIYAFLENDRRCYHITILKK